MEMMVLVIGRGTKKCPRGHSPTFNHKIKGKRGYFCTFLVETACVDGKGAMCCSDVPYNE